MSKLTAIIQSSSDDEEVMPDHPVGAHNLYEWRVCNKNFKFHPTLFEFDKTNSGINPNVPLQDSCSEFDCFKLFFDNDLVTYVYNETNRSCKQ